MSILELLRDDAPCVRAGAVRVLSNQSEGERQSWTCAIRDRLADPSSDVRRAALHVHPPACPRNLPVRPHARTPARRRCVLQFFRAYFMSSSSPQPRSASVQDPQTSGARHQVGVSEHSTEPSDALQEARRLQAEAEAAALRADLAGSIERSIEGPTGGCICGYEAPTF